MKKALFALILTLWAAPAFAQSSSGWPMPGLQHYSTTDATGHEISAVVCSTACSWFQADGYNAAAATRYVMLFNASALPSNGTVPSEEIPVATGQPFSRLGYNEWMSTGLVIACSTTEGTLTITASKDCFFHVGFMK